jgi:cytochrome c-type biogenesis protein
MTSSIFFGGSIIAAVIAGALALFAPCCISFMLPAFFAGSFQNRLRLVAMTFVFAAGVATIILPVALGASLVRQVLVAQHSAIYVGGGILLLLLGGYLLLGGQIHLPMPGQRAGGRTGMLSVYTLGIFSGITSSCCAPVLAGVVALASVAPSFALAPGLGTAYVFGMVFPLFLIALLWERFDWRNSRLFRPRSFTWRVGSIQRTVGATGLASGVLLLILGGTLIWVGFTERATAALSGWQASFAVTLQHVGQLFTRSLAWLPNWGAALLVLLIIGLLTCRALRQVGGDTHDDEPEQDELLKAHNDTPMKEPVHE